MPEVHAMHCYRALHVALLALLAGPALAAPANYQCTGYKPLKAEFTPRTAQIHFGTDDWTLQRVRDSREAMYVDRRAGVTVTLKKGAMLFKRGEETLQCKLLTNALTPENLGVPAPAPPASR
jgi:hypothetical protein